VQTYFLWGAPFSTTRTRWTLGAQIRLVFLLEWLTLLPEETPLLHISQNFAIDFTPPLRVSQFKQKYIIIIKIKLQGIFFIIAPEAFHADLQIHDLNKNIPFI